MKFSYQPFRGSYYPIIPVSVVRGGREVNTSAVVDSGASVSIFSGDICKKVGLDTVSGEKRVFQGASAKLAGYVHEVGMVIAGRKSNAGSRSLTNSRPRSIFLAGKPFLTNS